VASAAIVMNDTVFSSIWNPRSGFCASSATGAAGFVVPGAAFSALERLRARKLYRLQYIPRWVPIRALPRSTIVAFGLRKCRSGWSR
jgi:hypothetical protein